MGQFVVGMGMLCVMGGMFIAGTDMTLAMAGIMFAEGAMFGAVLYWGTRVPETK